ncbi:MAG TPA: hypothetical protein VGK99_06595 [Acidobacteriota bacterium]
MIGTDRSPFLAKGKWQVFTGYRFQRSDRHFVGKVEQKNRLSEGSEVLNNIHLMDFGATYSFNERLSMSVSMPLLIADRSQRSAGSRFTTETNGIGDLAVSGRTWLGNPSTHSQQNISVGLGVKFPTGEPGNSDTFLTASGPQVRTVDQSIQAGDGGYGFILDTMAFKRIKRSTVTLAGTYLFNPKDTNGVPTFRGRPSEAIMSVADQYLLRLGVSYPIFPEHGFSLTMAGRWEGIPARDLIGKSNGFRRPGYAVSLEPGWVLSRGGDTVGFSVPFAISRNRTRSVSDILVGRQGDAAFADYIILIGYSHRF